MESDDFCSKQVKKLGTSIHKIQIIFFTILKQNHLIHFCMGQIPPSSCKKITLRHIIKVDMSLIYYFFSHKRDFFLRDKTKQCNKTPSNKPENPTKKPTKKKRKTPKPTNQTEQLSLQKGKHFTKCIFLRIN